jgi:hypothetical protein
MSSTGQTGLPMSGISACGFPAGIPRAALSAVIMVIAVQHFDLWRLRLMSRARSSKPSNSEPRADIAWCPTPALTDIFGRPLIGSDGSVAPVSCARRVGNSRKALGLNNPAA